MFVFKLLKRNLFEVVMYGKKYFILKILEKNAYKAEVFSASPNCQMLHS